GGRSLVVVLNRRGLWVVLGLVAAVRAVTRTRGVVLVPVVGGWLADQLRGNRALRRLAGVVDEFLAETPRLVADLRDLGLDASELVNFRDLPLDDRHVRSAPHRPLRLVFAGRVRGDKGVVLA